MRDWIHLEAGFGILLSNFNLIHLIFDMISVLNNSCYHIYISVLFCHWNGDFWIFTVVKYAYSRSFKIYFIHHIDQIRWEYRTETKASRLKRNNNTCLFCHVSFFFQLIIHNRLNAQSSTCLLVYLIQNDMKKMS